MPKLSRGSVLTKGLAGAAALAAATQAYGTVVVVTPPPNIPGHDPAGTTSTTPTRIFIDLDGNGTNDLQIAYRSFTSGAYQIQQSFVFAISGQTAAAAYGTQYYAYKLAGGVTIPGGYGF